MRKIKDVMNVALKTISPEETLDNIIELMKERGIGRLPVVRGEKVLGVVTRDDILIKEEVAPLPPVIAFWDLLITLPGNKNFQDKLKKMASYKAEELMSTKFLVSKEDDPLEEVVTKMLEEGYPYTLILEGEKLKGMVTKSDLINNCF